MMVQDCLSTFKFTLMNQKYLTRIFRCLLLRAAAIVYTTTERSTWVHKTYINLTQVAKVVASRRNPNFLIHKAS